MANEKNIMARMQQKHDIEANWNKAGIADNPFIPKEAEIIIYDPDNSHTMSRFKIGDGIHTINELPFVTHNILGKGASGVEQIPDGVKDGFNFTGKNENAINLDPSLNGTIAYGATGAFASAFGGKSAAMGKRSHAEGTTTIAKGAYSHAEGDNSVALGNDTHAEGYKTTAYAEGSHTEGGNTITKGKYSHAEGEATVTEGHASHAEGYNSSTGVDGGESEGDISAAHAEGYENHANGRGAHAEGVHSTALAEGAHAEGNSTATGNFAHSEGWNTRSEGEGAHAEGYDTLATGDKSHAEGDGTHSYGNASHTEGTGTEAYGNFSHAEGEGTITCDAYNGNIFLSSAEAAHAEGRMTKAMGIGAHAEGIDTEAYGDAQHVEGKYNISDIDLKYAHIIGNGTAREEGMTSNAHTVDWDGNAWYAGDVYVGSDSGKQQDEGSKKLATQDYVNSSTEEKLEGYQTKIYGYREQDDAVPSDDVGPSSIALRPRYAEYAFEPEGISFSPASSEDELSIRAHNAWGHGRLYTDIRNGQLKYYADYYSEPGGSDNIVYEGTKTIAFKEDIGAEFDLVVTTEEDFRKCTYMLHPNKNEDDSVDLTTKGEPNLDFNYRYILVRDIDFTEDLGTSDLNLAVFQPSIRYIKFDNCQWHCQWWISGEKPTILKYDNNGVPTEYARAPGNFHVILDGINISEQNVIDSYPTVEDPDRYYYVGLRNIERIENCFIDYPSDYALIENFNEDGTSAGFSYTFKFNLQYFDCVQNCKITALWDGANVSNCRVSERIVRCTNCSNIIGEPIYRDGALYRVQMRESQGLSNISGSPIIYTNCSRVDDSTCAGYGGSKNPEYDLIISTVNEFKELPNNTTATSVLVAIPGKISATARVPGFFDNDSSNAPYFSKFIIPKNIKYIKFADCFGGITAPRVIIQGHENCVIDGLPTLDSPFYYSNCETIYNFKEARNCKTRNWQLSPALKAQKIDLSKTTAGTINTEGWLQDNTDYTVTFTLNCVNATVGSVVFRTDADNEIIGHSLSENKSYSFTFNSGSKANTGSFYFDCSLVDATKTGSVTVSPITIARVDKQLIFTTRAHGLSNVLSWGPDISQYPELGPDIAEQKTKFINCDLGTIDGAAAIENCTVCSQSNTMKNVNRISGLTIQYCSSSSNNFILSNCSNLSSINHGNSTITYTNCAKIDANSCDDAPETTLTGYATTQYVDEAVKNVKVDLTGYATETYVNNKIANCATKDDIGNINNILLALHEGGI